jgi:hypothetical protein
VTAAVVVVLVAGRFYSVRLAGMEDGLDFALAAAAFGAGGCR